MLIYVCILAVICAASFVAGTYEAKREKPIVNGYVPLANSASLCFTWGSAIFGGIGFWLTLFGLLRGSNIMFELGLVLAMLLPALVCFMLGGAKSSTP